MRFFFLAPCALVLLTACGGGGGGTTAVAQPTPAPTTCPITVAKASPSFAADIVPALQNPQAGCSSNAASCHGGTSPTGHISYSGTPTQIHAALVNVIPANAPPGWVLVKPGDPAHSWLIQKVTKTDIELGGYGTRMPQGTSNLCQPTIDTLSAWITAGAPNN